MLGELEPRNKGQGLVEYSLIILLVAVALIIVLGILGSQVSNVFAQVASALDPVASGGGGGGGNPPECYGTLLLPAMMGLTAVSGLLSNLLGRKLRPTA